MTDVTLRVNGSEFAGWTAARVVRSIESIAGTFELQVSERWGGQAEPWLINEGDECAVLVGGTKVLVGYVDSRELAYGATEHSLSVSGRDKTGDLVDCSALLSKWEFKGVSVLAFAKKVAAQFEISVALQSGLALPANPAKLSVDPGDSGFDCIEKACRLAGLLPVSDGAGGLLLTRAGSSRATTELVQGENILSASAKYDVSGRFSRYVVLAQHRGTDEFMGEQAASIRATADDLNIPRTGRILVIRPEDNATTAHAKKRAEWEATVRAARGDSATVTVQGWTQADGSLWPLNALVGVRSSLLGIDGEMLISEVEYSLDDGGTTTRLTLRPPNAFAPEPVITKAATGAWKEIAGGV